MRLHRLSLDATGHVWEANVFMALSLISQAIFLHPPLAFCVYMALNHFVSGKRRPFVSETSDPCAFGGSAHLQAPGWVTGAASLQLWPRAAFILRTHGSRRDQSVNMDYLPDIGKICMSVHVCARCWTASCFISHVNEQRGNSTYRHLGDFTCRKVWWKNGFYFDGDRLKYILSLFESSICRRKIILSKFI